MHLQRLTPDKCRIACRSNNSKNLKIVNQLYRYKYARNYIGSCTIGLYVIGQAGDHGVCKDKRTETNISGNQFRNARGFVTLIVSSLSILKLISVFLGVPSSV